jgi:AraC-like DNA-binding protein
LRGDRFEAGPERLQFVGREGLRRINGTTRFTPQDPDAFQAEYRRLELTDCSFESLRVSACSGTTDAQPSTQREQLHLGTLVAGRSAWRTGKQTHDQQRGAVHLLRGTDAVEFDWAQPVHVLTVRIPAAAVPAHLLADGVLRSGVLARTPLTNGFSGFLHQLAAGPVVLDTVERGHLDRALRALASGVLAVAAAESQVADDDLRYAIHDYIERHLLEPGLDPTRIASALGVSVRWVHQVFNHDGESVARYIRHRRLDLVAEALQSDPRSSGVSGLSRQFGFGGRDQLTRAFRSRFGMTVSEYRDRVRDSAPLPDRLPAPDERVQDRAIG